MSIAEEISAMWTSTEIFRSIGTRRRSGGMSFRGATSRRRRCCSPSRRPSIDSPLGKGPTWPSACTPTVDGCSIRGRGTGRGLQTRRPSSGWVANPARTGGACLQRQATRAMGVLLSWARHGTRPSVRRAWDAGLPVGVDPWAEPVGTAHVEAAFRMYNPSDPSRAVSGRGWPAWPRRCAFLGGSWIGGRSRRTGGGAPCCAAASGRSGTHRGSVAPRKTPRPSNPGRGVSRVERKPGGRLAPLLPTRPRCPAGASSHPDVLTPYVSPTFRQEACQEERTRNDGFSQRWGSQL